MIDIGAYANLRKLANKFKEIDVTVSEAKEQCRNAPVLEGATLEEFFTTAPKDAEKALILEVEDEEDVN